MDMSNKNSKLRILIFVLLGLLPLAAIALGVILLTADTIVNITFLLTFVIFPVASIVGLALRDYKLDYPKYLAFIATNDAENEIGYIWFYDVELDYIESMTDLINNDCGWKYIR